MNESRETRTRWAVWSVLDLGSVHLAYVERNGVPIYRLEFDLHKNEIETLVTVYLSREDFAELFRVVSEVAFRSGHGQPNAGPVASAIDAQSAP